MVGAYDRMEICLHQLLIEVNLLEVAGIVEHDVRICRNISNSASDALI